MKLRWLVRCKRETVTAEEVVCERQQGEGLLECKERLLGREAPVLQVLEEYEVQGKPGFFIGSWVDVPVVVEAKQEVTT